MLDTNHDGIEAVSLMDNLRGQHWLSERNRTTAFDDVLQSKRTNIICIYVYF